jgi:hypothetical protein
MRHTQLDSTRSCNADKSFAANICVLSLLLCLTSLTIACGAASQGAGSASSPSGEANPSGELRVSTPPAQGTVGIAYNAVTTVAGGAAPYIFSITGGSLPPGLVLNSRTGSITGTPLVAGTYNFTLYASTLPRTENGSIPEPSIPEPKTPTLSGKEYGLAAAHIVVSASGSGTLLSISPVSTTVASQAQQRFTASVTGTANTGVTWSASAGTISSTGVFTAPKVTSNTSVVITATSVANGNSHAAATVTVTPVAALVIATSGLPVANASTPYTASLSATGGVPPYQWSFTTGALPSGIQLQASSGAISGMTTLTGSFPFTAKVTDSSGQSATLALNLAVSSGSASGYDGPAQLPLIYIQTAMSNTPAPGSTLTVNSGGDLQSALNSANCGDTIQLQAGATFTGLFTFPPKSCDDNHWIIVRTSASDSALPAEGSRLTPCYAGVSSLPGRPAFQCASTNNVVAKLVMAASGSGPINFALGANHYRLTGLEVTRLAGTGIVYALASVSNSGAANNLIFDRVWLHGTAQDETTRGVDLGGSTYTSVVDSFFTDFHCISATGACTDSQAINGGLGDDQIGPYKIVDNFLESAGENILFGGGEATATPTDIQVSQNHMFKPLTWMKGQPGYVGGANGNPFIVKNLFELKNAQRVLLDGNIMEDSWGGFSQVGFGILITPINQSNLCPVCQVTDVTIRYNSISHVAAGLQIANALAHNDPPLDGQRYSIHDIVIDDIDAVKYNGPGEFAQVSISTGDPILQNVTINHVTAFPTKTMFFIGTLPSVPMKNFVFTNSIVNAGIYPVWSTGNEGTAANCAAQDSPLITFNACFSNYIFAANAIVDTPSLAAPATWPSGNFFPATAAAVQFVNYNGGNGGNYQLQPSSPYKGKGTDGLDLGADVAAINSATAGVE